METPERSEFANGKAGRPTPATGSSEEDLSSLALCISAVYEKEIAPCKALTSTASSVILYDEHEKVVVKVPIVTARFVKERSGGAVPVSHAELVHPNILKFIGEREFGRWRGEVMEKADIDMDRLCREPGFEQHIPCVLRQVLAALAYLHAQNIAHLDIKPENILLVGKCVKLCDFGLTLRMGSHPCRLMWGTPFFSAPEIILLSSPGFGVAADVWSLGATVHFLETREMPFEANDFKALRASVSGWLETRYPPKGGPIFSAFVNSCLTVAAERPSVGALSRALLYEDLAKNTSSCAAPISPASLCNARADELAL
jgi:serine/threonine protein kinase